MTVDKILEKFEVIKDKKQTFDLDRIKKYNDQIKTIRDEVIESEKDRQHNAKRIKIIRDKILSEKQKIKEYNDLIENFFDEIDLDTYKISYPGSNSTILKFDRENKTITYENAPLDTEDKYEKIILD